MWHAFRWSVNGLAACWKLESSFRLEVYLAIPMFPLALWLAGWVNVWDVIMWVRVMMLLQLFAFRFVDFLLGSLSARIEANERSAAIFLATMKVAIACLTAAAVAG